MPFVFIDDVVEVVKRSDVVAASTKVEHQLPSSVRWIRFPGFERRTSDLFVLNLDSSNL